MSTGHGKVSGWTGTEYRQLYNQGGSPSEILQFTNEALVEENASDMFVTIWLGILDTKTGVVCGVLEGMEYEDYTITLPKGGKLFVYTDDVDSFAGGIEQFDDITMLSLWYKG